MLTFDLFAWWTATISGGIAFLIVVSIYLYARSKTTRIEGNKVAVRKPDLARDFIFVWVLIGLLVFYVISVKVGSPLIFAAGNMMVEVLLIVYLIWNRK